MFLFGHKMLCWLGACLLVCMSTMTLKYHQIIYISIFFFFNLKGWRWVCPQTVTPLSQSMCNVIQTRIRVRYMWSVNMWWLQEHEHNYRFLSPGTSCQHQHPSKWRHFNYHRRIQRTLHTLTNWNHWSCCFWLPNATMIICNNNDEWRRWLPGVDLNLFWWHIIASFPTVPSCRLFFSHSLSLSFKCQESRLHAIFVPVDKAT